MKDTFGSTNSLKGLAICAVVINHFLNLNIKGNYLGFASIFVCLFFIASGYGIYCSLERSSREGPFQLKNLLWFYFSRLVRIYPLFILAYTAQCLLFDDPFTSWSVWGIRARGHYWFITAIIQCYLLAPLIFIFIRKRRFLSLNIFLIVFVTANLLLNSGLLPAFFDNTFRLVHLHWRDVYFLYLLLFALSMMLPHYLSCWFEIPPYEKK